MSYAETMIAKLEGQPTQSAQTTAHPVKKWFGELNADIVDAGFIVKDSYGLRREANKIARIASLKEGYAALKKLDAASKRVK